MCILWIVGGTQRYVYLVLLRRGDIYGTAIATRLSTVSRMICEMLRSTNTNLLNAEAMDRIHRLGQRRPVQAIKLVIEDSIESRIVQVLFSAVR